MALLAPLFALAALAAVPIVLLYLLKMKRQERVISSTLLWQQTLKDLEANVPFQRLRANLLLILQMLVLALLVLALMRPTLPASYRLGERSVLVLDTSASMLATDAAEGTRFDRARSLARKLVDSLDEGQQMMILAGGLMVSDGFVGDKARLHKVIDRLEPGQVEADCAAALQLAYSALTAGGDAGGGESGAGGVGPGGPGVPGDAARPRTGGRIFLISDGAGLALPADIEDLDDYLTYFTVGKGSDNVGIIGLQFRRPPEQAAEGQLFVNVANFSTRERTVLVSLRRRGESAPIDAKELTLKAGQSSGATFDRAFDAGRYVVALGGDGDRLELDDEAYLVLGDNRLLRVMLVGRGNPALERILGAAAGVEAVRVEPEKYEPSDEWADLLFFDRVVPDHPPSGRTAVFFAPERTVGVFERRGVLPFVRIFDWNRDDPVMRFVSMSDVQLGEAGTVKLAAHAKLVPLVWSEDAMLVGYAHVGPVRHYCVAFDVARTSWPQTVSFPIFMGNILDEARAARQIGQALCGKAGRIRQIGGLEPGETVRVETPSGETFSVAADGVTASFRETGRVGFYEVRSAAGSQTFALNLDSPRESNIAPRTELRGRADQTVAGRSELASGTREIWPWAALAAVVLLTLEWYVYHRRIA